MAEFRINCVEMVRIVMPNLSDQDENNLLNSISEAGVDSVADLVYLKEDDLNSPSVKKTQARKLILCFKNSQPPNLTSEPQEEIKASN
jgi:hypothetical protein